MGKEHVFSDNQTVAHPRILDGQAECVQSTAVVSREIAGETIVVPICRGVGDLDSVYTFNELGTELWRLLSETRTAENLAKWVSQNYEVSQKQAFGDVRSFLLELLDAGLIRLA
jgi:hypothetical protein